MKEGRPQLEGVTKDFIKDVTLELRLEECSRVFKWINDGIPDRGTSVHKGDTEVRQRGVFQGL